MTLLLCRVVDKKALSFLTLSARLYLAFSSTKLINKARHRVENSITLTRSGSRFSSRRDLHDELSHKAEVDISHVDDKTFSWLMNFTETTIAGGCMRFEIFRRIKTRRAGRDRKRESTPKASLTTRKRFTRRQITELLFENCIDCGKMAAIPQGAFAAYKVRCNDEYTVSMSVIEGKEKTEEKKENIFKARPPLEGWELTPLKYNSKLMNSIWGLYNRYSVHNFKKNTDAKEGACGGVAATIWDAILKNHPPTTNTAATATATVEAPRIMRTGNGL